jgi:hypothetical protein
MRSNESANAHLSEDVLELYSLGRLPEAELDRADDHLLICHTCQDKLQETDDYIRAVRAAAAELEAAPQRSSNWRQFVDGLFAIPKPAWAAAGAAALAALMLPVFNPSTTTPQSVELSAYRNSQSASVNEGAPLSLQLPRTATGSFAEIVKAAGGAAVWSGTPVREGEMLTLKVEEGLTEGAYWVRLYADSTRTEQLYEYALVAK